MKFCRYFFFFCDTWLIAYLCSADSRVTPFDEKFDSVEDIEL